MASQKIQRWIDLLAALLRRRFPASLEELAREIPGYDTGQNKAALRALNNRIVRNMVDRGEPGAVMAFDWELRCLISWSQVITDPQAAVRWWFS